MIIMPTSCTDEEISIVGIGAVILSVLNNNPISIEILNYRVQSHCYFFPHIAKALAFLYALDLIEEKDFIIARKKNHDGEQEYSRRKKYGDIPFDLKVESVENQKNYKCDDFDDFLDELNHFFPEHKSDEEIKKFFFKMLSKKNEVISNKEHDLHHQYESDY